MKRNRNLALHVYYQGALFAISSPLLSWVFFSILNTLSLPFNYIASARTWCVHAERQRRRVRLFTLCPRGSNWNFSRVAHSHFPLPLGGLSAAGILAFRWLSAMEMIICRAARPLLQQQQRKTGIKQFNSWAARVTSLINTQRASQRPLSTIPRRSTPAAPQVNFA